MEDCCEEEQARIKDQPKRIDLLHEYCPLPQPLSQNGRGEPELALLL
jgi:hypothetical protein